MVSEYRSRIANMHASALFTAAQVVAYIGNVANVCNFMHKEATQNSGSTLSGFVPRQTCITLQFVVPFFDVHLLSGSPDAYPALHPPSASRVGISSTWNQHVQVWCASTFYVLSAPSRGVGLCTFVKMAQRSSTLMIAPETDNEAPAIS